MRGPLSDEMHRLMDIIKPYKEGHHLKDNAPSEAIEAMKKLDKLVEEDIKNNHRIDLL